MKSTTRFYKNKKGLECLNCGQPLRGKENFCPECGQVNDELPLSLKQFISEFFIGFFSFDTKFFKTIVPLLFKPGNVSKEYIEGKRRKYSNPFKMYLHTSIVFFLLMGLVSTINDFKQLDDSKLKDNAIKDSILVKELEDSGIEVGQLDFIYKYNQKLDSVFNQTNYKSLFNNDSISQDKKDSLYQQLIALGMNTKLINVNLNSDEIGDIDLNELLSENAQKPVVKKQLKDYFKQNKVDYTVSKSHKTNDNSDISSVFLKNNFGQFYSFSKDNEDISPNDALDSLQIEKTRMNLFKYQKARDLNKLLKDKDFQKLYINNIISNLSIAIFFLLPIFTFFVSLLYIRHRYNYTEHLVVVFNLQTVFFILLIVLLISGLISNTILDFALTIFPLLLLFYIYKTLRNFYQQARFKTILKFLLLNIVYLFLAFIGISVVSFLSFLV